jgi:diguanylate cyclase (GGDEF)-like protein/PAS domain S-box-containing protein
VTRPPVPPPPAELTPPIRAGVERFARRWARALAGTGYVPMTAAQAEVYLCDLSARLVDAVGACPFDANLARPIGAALVTANYRTAAALRHTLTALGGGFADDIADLVPAEVTATVLRARTAALAGALAEGFTEALRARTLAEQEQMQHAALAAVRAAEEGRRTTQARFAAVFAEAAVGIGLVDPIGRVIDVNAAMADMLGHPPQMMRGRNVEDLVGPTPDPATFALYRELLAGTRDRFRTETTRVRPDGRTVHLDLSMSTVRDEHSQPRFVIGVAVDITERRQLSDRLWHEARHDALTGLPNRTLFFERLATLLASTERGARVGVCYLDLDGFKSVNDSRGHHVGDRLLVAVGERLSAAVADDSRLLARLGGDEFVVLSHPCATGEDMAHTAEAVLAALAAPFDIDGHEFTISASIGVVDTTTAATDPTALMRAADITLYRAKAEGKGRWVRHDPHRHAHQVTRHTLATCLPKALADEQFHLAYQPMVALADGSLRGVEALARWRHPQLGPLPPEQFIAVAEETGHIAALGRWVLTQACHQASRWHRQCGDVPVYVSVNVAVGQLHQPGLVDDVLATLAATGLPAHLLQLELTESAVLGDTHGPLDALHQLAAAGVRIAIDDFGTGYSNLAHLARLPAHELKIAGSFLQPQHPGGPTDPTHDKIVAAIIALAHDLGLGVTAEGVENNHQADRLRALHCDTAQGWFFAHPGPAEHISRLIAATARYAPQPNR